MTCQATLYPRLTAGDKSAVGWMDLDGVDREDLLASSAHSSLQSATAVNSRDVTSVHLDGDT